MSARGSAVIRGAVVFACLAVVGASGACGGHDSNGAPPATTTSCDAGFDPTDAGCVPHVDECGETGLAKAGGGCVTVGVPSDGCGTGFVFDGHGGCTATLPKDACTGATMAVPGDAACKPVGVETCADGFSSDGAGGCTAKVPSTPCAPGTMAIPGDATCRDVASCGAAPWGDLPSWTGATIYVDAAYAGGSSDGSASKPFTGVQRAIDAASATTPTLVAVAAGTYVENISLKKPVHLFGRCPSMVEIRGKDGATPTIAVATSGAAAEVHRLAVRGASAGSAPAIDATGAATLDSLWIHDVADQGVFVHRGPSPTDVQLVDSLVEHASVYGVRVVGASLTVERTAVRDTQAGVDGMRGRGIQAEDDIASGTPSKLVVRKCLLERNRSSSLTTFASTVTIEGTLVRDTQPQLSDSTQGYGLIAQDKADVTVRGTVFVNARDIGVVALGSSITLENTVIRDTQAKSSDGTDGRGLEVQADATTKQRSTVTLRHVLVDHNRDVGVFASSSTLDVESSIVRDTQPATGGAYGRGIGVQEDKATKGSPDLTLKDSLVDHNREVGVYAAGGKTTIDGTVVRDTRPQESDHSGGRGIDVEVGSATTKGTTIQIVRSVVERNTQGGIAASGSAVTIDSTVVRETRPNAADALDGRGIEVHDDVVSKVAASLTLTRSLIEANEEVGVAIAGATGTIDATVVRATRPQSAAKIIGVGVAVIGNKLTGVRGQLQMHSSLVDDNAYGGVVAMGADATLDLVLVRRTKPDASAGAYGDGLVAMDGPIADFAPGVITLTISVVRDNARCGASGFGGKLALSSSLLGCNAIDIDVETSALPGAAIMATVDDGGGNVCGCGASRGTCRAQTSNAKPIKPPG